MTIYLSKIEPGFFEDEPLEDNSWEDSWVLHALIDDGHPAQNLTFKDIRALGVTDREKARKVFQKLKPYLDTGQAFDKLFDGHQCHPGHTFDYCSKPHEIYRFRLAGNTRIFYETLPNKHIVVLMVIVKPGKSMNKKDASELVDRTKKFLNCVAENKINYIENKS